MAEPRFVHLRVHSDYSMIDGLAKTGPLVKKAAALGMPALAITDFTNLCGLVKFYGTAHGAGIKPIVGADFHVQSEVLGDEMTQISVLAMNNTGYQIIGDRVEIGACTTIDRGALDDTIIGNGVIIDNQCQIAHNVVIGDNTAVAGGVIMAGSLKIGRYCMIGGASVINGHMEICDKVTVTGMGMVMRPITEPGVYSSGIPLQPNKVWRKTAALVMNIDDMSKRLKAIERKIDQQD